MKKMGIVTLYDDINIGNKLQNYAVQTYFEGMGYKCKTIPHWEMAHCKLTFQSLKLEVIIRSGFPQKSAEKLRLVKKRKKKFQQFSDKYLKLANSVKINSLPSNLAEQYDYFVVGSDQVWHNWTKSKSEIDYFCLQFAKKNQRLTISPSFGKNSIEPEFEKDYLRGLSGFSVITCREEQGAEIVKKYAGKKAIVLLDPTMLVEETKWLAIEKKPNYLPVNYILVYALGEQSTEVQKFIKNIALEKNWKIVDIHNPSEKELYLTTPDEFIYYIKHAKIVVTDSFHASVFSILFGTNFVVFDRNTSNMGNMTSRLDTLLDKFSLMDRKFALNVNPYGADFSKVSEVLITERARAKKIYEDTFKMLDSIEADKNRYWYNG
ncbi:Polysaccharide pyruvyl transferase [anaerobic digester metagenome]